MMTTTAPTFRAVDALTGEKTDRPHPYRRALSEADSYCREVAAAEDVRAERDELLTRVQELTAERDEALALVRQWRETALSAIPHVEGDL